jgi:membrane protein implicated in regulation of membrane protease activity
MPKSPRKELLHFGIGLIVIATLLLLGAIAIGVLYFLHAGTVSTFVDAKPLLVLLFFLFITLAILFIWIANLALRNRKYLPDGSPNPVVDMAHKMSSGQNDLVAD